MKVFCFLVVFCLVCTFSYAKDYMVERDDGGVSIVKYFEGSKDSLQKVLKDLGFEGKEAVEIDMATLPSRADRKYWKKSGNLVTVDQVKKQQDLDKQAQLEADKEAVLLKLKISKAEFEKLKK